jgi:hypothetical protein
MADTLEGLYKDPAGTAGHFAKEVLAHPYAAIARGVEAAKAGKYEEAAAHFNNILEPAGFLTEGSEVKAATPGKRAEGYGELLGTGLNAYLSAKAPDIASGIKDKVSAGKELVSQVLDHPKVQAAIKDVAVELAKEVPGVKTTIKAGKVASAAKEVYDDIRGAKATSGVPVAAAPPPLPAEPPQIPKSEPAAAPPSESTAPPAAYMDTETTGLQVPRHMANRAAMAQRFVDKLGGTQNLPTNESEWVRLANDLGERVPSPETRAQIEFGLNRRMVTKTETPGSIEVTEPAVAKNPKALKIAQQLQEEMRRSGTAPSMPVGVKGNAVDIESVGPGSTVTLKSGKTVTVKKLNPDGSFEY